MSEFLNWAFGLQRIGPLPEHFKSDVPAWDGVFFVRRCKAFCPHGEQVVGGKLVVTKDTQIIESGIGKPYLANMHFQGVP